jgi:hypothetical protein
MSSNQNSILYYLIEQPGTDNCETTYDIGIKQLTYNEMENIVNKSTKLNQVARVKQFCDQKIKEGLKSETPNKENLNRYQDILKRITNKYATFVGPGGTQIRIIRRNPQTRMQLFPNSFNSFATPQAGGTSGGGSGFTNYSKSHLIKRIESKLKGMKKDKVKKILKGLYK